MDRGSSEYPQSGLPSSASYSQFSNNQTESQTNEQSTTNYQSSSQDRSVVYSSSATPSSEYGGTGNSTARAPNFQPEYNLGASRFEGGPRYSSGSAGTGSSGGMSHASHSNFSPLPPLAQSLHRPPYTHPHPATSASGWRPDWPPQGYAQPPHMAYSAHPGASGGVASPAGPVRNNNNNNRNPNRKRISDQQPQHPLSQVYSFVPIPGAQQHKRPRRRYEEIERMYKCGWHGCEKAYGTLNHLNAHVTMQSHGIKRTPEEFKEIRKEWKARKKQEEAERKAVEEEARRSSAEGGQPGEVQNQAPASVPVSGPQYTPVPPRQLPPPLPYTNTPVPANVHYPAAPTAAMESMPQYPQQQQVYPGYPQSGYPQSMYAAQRPAPIQTANSGEGDGDADADPDVAATAQSYSQHSLNAS
ncbi:hypothetical protein C7212DRAFT_352349 [Tuber magnatum]|uniref:C2H2-type domain-containing protein n=1 Tax=Tuber magnatum TaxID=42249 RepID=A0A317SM47_9PEZI|nr:hypothetical protein C7212DRAFT_352349 [Tuber magnatum]